MLKLKGHFTKVIFLLLLTLPTVTSCRLFQPTAYFFISNQSQDRKAVDIEVKLAGQTVYGDTIKWTDKRPDLQYTPYHSVSNGKYTIIVTADSGRVKVTQPIMLDTDKFIFITYNYAAPVDSATLIKKYGFVYPERLKGQEPKVGIFITDKEPEHM